MNDVTEDLQDLIEWLIEAEMECRRNAENAYEKLDDAHAPGSTDAAHLEPSRLKGMADGIKLSRARLIATLKVAHETEKK